MHIVIDTNLFIAAFYNQKSASAQILKMAARGDIAMLWTKEIREESRHIVGKVPVKDEFRKMADALYKEEYEIHSPPAIAISDDPDDNKFIACAIKGKADMIVTSDSDLLDVKDRIPVPVLTPTQALKKIKEGA